MAAPLQSVTNAGRPGPPPSKRSRPTNSTTTDENRPATSGTQPSVQRPGPPGGDTGGDDDDDPPPEEPEQNADVGSKRKMSWSDAHELPQHPLSVPSRHYCRTVDAYGPVSQMLELAVWLERQKVAGRPLDDIELCDYEEVWLSQWQSLEKTYNTAMAKLKKSTKANVAAAHLPLIHWLTVGGIPACTDKMRISRKAARAEDAKEAKDWLQSYQEWSPSLHNLPKSERGFRHAQICKLLTPLHDKDKIETDPQLLEDYVQRRRGLHPDVYLPFMYHKHEVPDNKWKGFLRGDLLYRMGKMLLTGVASLAPGSRPSSKSKAAKNNMIEMTFPAIAWVTTVTLFALSADETFQSSTDGPGIHYITFYQRLVDTLETAEERRQTELLKWWNKKLFGDRQVSIPLPDGVQTTVEEMNAQPIEDDEFSLDDD